MHLHGTWSKFFYEKTGNKFGKLLLAADSFSEDLYSHDILIVNLTSLSIFRETDNLKFVSYVQSAPYEHPQCKDEMNKGLF